MPSRIPAHSNHYGPDLAQWKADLILRRAVRVGFRSDELPEVQQDLAPTIAAFIFDPDRANGACERTVFTAVIDRQLQRLLRNRARYHRAIATVRQEAELRDSCRNEPSEAVAITRRDLQDDVQACLSRLDSGDQAICLGFADGDSALAIRERLSLTRRELEAALRRIQSVFRALGMDAWLGAA